MSFNIEQGPEVDFDDMYETWLILGSLEEELSRYERELNIYRASFKVGAMRNSAYWPTNKVPTAEYLKQVVHFIGNTPEDAELIQTYESRIAEIRREYTQTKGKLEVMEHRIRVWQTQSANARKTLVVE